MTNQASLELDGWAAQMESADRVCRQDTGQTLSPSFRALMFTMALHEARGQRVDWPAVAETMRS